MKLIPMDIFILEPGSRVQATGLGKTQRYKNRRGTVSQVMSDQFVYVKFDNTDTTTVLLPDEVKLETHDLCPCGICTHH